MAFELVVWAHMAAVKVLLVFGGSMIDMLEYYGSALPALPVDAPENIFVACSTSCVGAMLSGSLSLPPGPGSGSHRPASAFSHMP